MTFQISAKLLDACVLAVLARGDTYGYDLTQTMSGQMAVSETALYPVLRRLQKEGFLTAYNQESDGRNRKYYSITPSGHNQLAFLQAEWEAHKETIDLALGLKKEGSK